jgi:hypothetical protein
VEEKTKGKKRKEEEKKPRKVRKKSNYAKDRLQCMMTTGVAAAHRPVPQRIH